MTGRVSVVLAVVGGGPTCTYTMERLAATVPGLDSRVELDVHVFDRADRFGAGAVHSWTQPSTSFLNRIVGQVAFAADETVADAGPLLPPDQRPTLREWCRREFERTGDPAFDLAAEDWPKRYVHGLALRSQFELYVELLRAHPSVRVHLHPDEVVDLEEEVDGFRVVTRRGREDLVAHHVLMVTGHSTNDPARSPVRGAWAAFADAHEARFVSSAYPLEERLGTVTTGVTVACLGMGLTAIDVILHLTEGRGGRFHDEGGRLHYRPSGAEPRSIVAASTAGLFTFARPFNAKEHDLARLEHRGVFLTTTAVAALRESVGTAARIGPLHRRQLDFERDVLPLVVLEMAHLYHRTLLGPEFAAHLERCVRPAWQGFLAGAASGAAPEQALAHLVEPVEEVIAAAEAVVDDVLSGHRSALDPALPVWVAPAVRRYVTVVFGTAAKAELPTLLAEPAALARFVAGARSPHGHGRLLSDNRFSWPATIAPVPADSQQDEIRYRDAVIAFMRRDHLWAAQDNLTNPAKAAADGVWRDLRPVLAGAIDFGGLTAPSHRRFLEVFMRHHNRLANGAALEVMEKMLALVEHGLLDIAVGPGAQVGTDAATGRFTVRGPRTGAHRQVDVLIDARVHPFDPAADTSPVYPALLRRGTVRKWTNPHPGDGPAFEPGGLDLTADFHPRRSDGTVDDRLTFLGPPSEGVMFFQLGALRPQQNHHVMQDVLRWLRGFWSAVQQRADHADPLVPSAR